MEREFIDKPIEIDGRNIPYPVYTVAGYLSEHDGMTQDSIDTFQEEDTELYYLISEIIALKQSCFLLRRVRYSCESLPDSLYHLKEQLIKYAQEKYGYCFDEQWMENLCK